MVLEMSEVLRATLRVVKAEVAVMSVRLNLTMKTAENQTPAGVQSNTTRQRT